jgi:hypothetical protein
MKEMNALGVMAWAGVWSRGIVGPSFFHNTVTAHSYIKKLNKGIIPTIESQMNLKKMFYMSNGALPHNAQPVRDFLDRNFSNR